MNRDSTGQLVEKGAGGGGGWGGLAYAGPASGHIFIPTTPTKTSVGIPYIPLPPSSTYHGDSIRAEKIAIKKASRKKASAETSEETAVATITTRGKKPVYFPENPHEFIPVGLIPFSREGSWNGGFIEWRIPLTKIQVFRWDENTTGANGPHYHIYGLGHFYPGSVVPEPLASFYFWYLQ